MRLFKRNKEGPYYVEFRDHLERVRKLALFSDRKASSEFVKRLERLISFRVVGISPDNELSQWLTKLSPSYLIKLVHLGLLDKQRVSACKNLQEHLNDYEATLVSQGRSEKHVYQVILRARKIIDGCKFAYAQDIDAGKIKRYLSQLRDQGRGLSARTSNFYLQAMKQFVRWMLFDNRIYDNPIAYLRFNNPNLDIRHGRRALTEYEIERLYGVTKDRPVIYGLNGEERVMLYWFALETGLRASEIKSLKRINFSLDTVPATVRLEACYSKHRTEDILPLRKSAVKKLYRHFKGKDPMDLAFNMPHVTNCGKMIRRDYIAAGIRLVDDNDLHVDFHALRHTFITNLTRSGVHPKTAQMLARHSSVELTLGLYTHLPLQDQLEALKKLPEIKIRNNSQEGVA